MKAATDLRQHLANGNWVAYFEKALAAPYLLACLAHRFFPAMRAHALSVLARTNGQLAIPWTWHTLLVVLQIKEQSDYQEMRGS